MLLIQKFVWTIFIEKVSPIGKDTEKGVEVRVHPTFVANSNPLATVSDSFNAVHILGDAVGEIMLYGRGAGDLPTGSAIVSDVIFASKHAEYYYTPFKNDEQGAKETKYVTDFKSQYYLRLLVDDKAGILSKFTAIFAKYNVSIKEVKQVLSENGKAEVILITHSCKESSIKKTLDKLKEFDGAIDVCSVIRIED